MSTAVAQRVTPARVVVSEWTKLRTLRSTVWGLLAAVGSFLVFALLITLLVRSNWPPDNPRDALTFDPVGVSLAGGFFAQLAIGVLGVLLMSGEYATGMIRATFAAVPRRLPVLWAKALVYAVTTFVLTSVAAFAAFFLGQAILSAKHIEASIGDPHVVRAIVGSALYLTVVGLLGLGLGALLRNTAGAISTLFGLLFVVPVVVHFLPASWNDAIAKYLPSNAGQVITGTREVSDGLGPWSGIGVFLLYALVALVVASVALQRRDA